MNNKCNKGFCGCSKVPQEQVSTESIDNKPINERELALEMELEKAKAELEKVKEQLSATTSRNLLGKQGFKACAEVCFTPNE